MSLNLEVKILGEYKNLTRATKGATKELKALQSSAQSISRKINASLGAIGVGLSIGALKGAIQSTITEASNLNESVNAVRVSFGLAGDAVLAIGQNAAKSFGLSKAEFNSAAVTFSGFADDVVGQGGDVAGFIEQITGRGADFASVFNIDVAEALSVFRSGLSGESEPLKRFGIILNDTAVKDYALRTGLIKTGQELTNQQKVQARYKLLLEETNKVQGDFANTSGEMANALRIAKAGFADAKVAIGEGFTPAITGIATWISDNLDIWTDLADAIGNKIKSAFEDSGDAATNFGTQIIKVVQDLTDFLNGTADSSNAFVKLSEKIKPILDLFGAFSELGKGVLAVLNGLFDGLFGWINLFLPANEQMSGFAGFVEWVGKKLQELGYWIGFIGSIFIPFTTGFKIAGKVLSLFSKWVDKIAAGIGKIAGGIGKWLESIGLKSIDKTVAKSAERAVLNAGDAAAGAAKGFDTLDAAAAKALETRKKWEAYKEFRLTNDLKFANTEAGFLRSGLSAVDKMLDQLNRKKTAIKIDMVINGATVGEANRFGNLKPDTIDWNQRNKEYGQAILAGIAEAAKTPETINTATGLTTFQKNVQKLVDVAQAALDEAKARIKDASESFRDTVSLSFGIISNGAFAVFDINRVIRQMNRVKDAAKTFASDIKKLQAQGADQSLIDQILGMDPMQAAATARGLLSSGRLNEFLKLRADLASTGAGAGGVANYGIYGTGTGGLQTAIDNLTKVVQANGGNTYNINVNNANNMTAQQIIAAIKKYEKTTGKKVF